jgi:hypothetical protein
MLAFGPLESLAALGSFLFAYMLAGWLPWEALAGTGSLYVEATTMTFAGIVMAQIGGAMAWRTDREPVFSIGLSPSGSCWSASRRRSRCWGCCPTCRGSSRSSTRAPSRVGSGCC